MKSKAEQGRGNVQGLRAAVSESGDLQTAGAEGQQEHSRPHTQHCPARAFPSPVTFDQLTGEYRLCHRADGNRVRKRTCSNKHDCDKAQPLRDVAEPAPSTPTVQDVRSLAVAIGLSPTGQ